MKKSVVSFIAVLLLICFLGVTAVTGVYIPGGWTMPLPICSCWKRRGPMAWRRSCSTPIIA